jgi:hypothetical protein
MKIKSNPEIPDYHMPTYKMMNMAFPNDIPEDDYLPLLAVLYGGGMTYRTVAELISAMTLRSYGEALHDVMTAHADLLESDITVQMRERLREYGYDEWINNLYM